MVAAAEIPPSELDKLPTALRAIAGAAGAKALDVLRGEAGVILKACAGATKVADAPRADKRSQLRFLRDLELTGKNTFLGVTVNAGVRKGAVFGRTFLRTSGGHWRRTHDSLGVGVLGVPSSGRKKRGDHYSDPEWLLVRSAADAVRNGIGAAREAGRKTIGLARQSWVQIADTLGIRLEDVRGGGTLSAAGIAKARRAIAYNGQQYQNGLGTQSQTAYTTIITLLNRYPRGEALGMDSTLRSVLFGRVRYFEKNLELGVFNSIWKTARAYPYLRVMSHG